MNKNWLFAFCLLLFCIGCTPKRRTYTSTVNRTSTYRPDTRTDAEPEPVTKAFLEDYYPYQAFSRSGKRKIREKYENIQGAGNSVTINKLLGHINALRKKNGRRTIEQSLELSETAKLQTVYMMLIGELTHDNRFYPDLTDRARQVKGLRPEPFEVISSIAENVYWMAGSRLPNTTENELAQKIIDSYAKSKGHRANMLDKDITHFGAYTLILNGELYNACIFARFN